MARGGGRHNERLQKVYHFTKFSSRDLPTRESKTQYIETVILSVGKAHHHLKHMNHGDVSWPEGGGRHNVRLQSMYHFTKFSNRDLPTIDSSLMHLGTIIFQGWNSKRPIEPQQTWEIDMAATVGDTQNDDSLHPI